MFVKMCLWTSYGSAKRENSRKNYRAYPHNEGAKNISIKIYKLRKKTYSAFLFLQEVQKFLRESTRKFPEQHGKILLV